MKVAKVLKWLGIFILTFLVMFLLHQYGTHERGYPAIGGEALIIVIPVLALTYEHEEKKYSRTRKVPASKKREPARSPVEERGFIK